MPAFEFGGMRADLLLGRGRQMLGSGEWQAHAACSTGPSGHLTVMLSGPGCLSRGANDPPSPAARQSDGALNDFTERLAPDVA